MNWFTELVDRIAIIVIGVVAVIVVIGFVNLMQVK